MRPFFENLKYHLNGKELVGAEIGVALAENACDFAKNLLLKKVYLVDHYSSYYNCNSQASQDQSFDAAREKMAFSNVVEFLRLPSEEASIHVPDGSLDFVYIDGDHREVGINSDIKAWFPKVRPYGFIGGHDFDSKEDYYAIMRVVTKFVTQEYPSILTVNSSDWWIQK